MTQPITTVILGAPNFGKSTLAQQAHERVATRALSLRVPLHNQEADVLTAIQQALGAHICNQLETYNERLLQAVFANDARFARRVALTSLKAHLESAGQVLDEWVDWFVANVQPSHRRSGNAFAKATPLRSSLNVITLAQRLTTWRQTTQQGNDVFVWIDLAGDLLDSHLATNLAEALGYFAKHSARLGIHLKLFVRPSRSIAALLAPLPTSLEKIDLEQHWSDSSLVSLADSVLTECGLPSLRAVMPAAWVNSLLHGDPAMPNLQLDRSPGAFLGLGQVLAHWLARHNTTALQSRDEWKLMLKQYFVQHVPLHLNAGQPDWDVRCGSKNIATPEPGSRELLQALLSSLQSHPNGISAKALARKVHLQGSESAVRMRLSRLRAKIEPFYEPGRSTAQPRNARANEPFLVYIVSRGRGRYTLQNIAPSPVVISR